VSSVKGARGPTANFARTRPSGCFSVDPSGPHHTSIGTEMKTATVLFGQFESNGFVPGWLLANCHVFVMPGTYERRDCWRNDADSGGALRTIKSLTCSKETLKLPLCGQIERESPVAVNPGPAGATPKRIARSA
jgi:hypothetical protein